MYKDKAHEPIPIKEARAFMKIREGMYMEGIKLFLNLMEGIPLDKIIKDEQFKDWMNFDQLLEEIITIINKTKGHPNFTKEIWLEVLKKLLIFKWSVPQDNK